MALTNEDLLAISRLLDPFKNELMEVMATKDDIANMATKDDIANMATKDDIANMATKDDLLQLENDILEELDIVQEHSNRNYYRLETQISQMKSDINTIKCENSTVNLLLTSVSELQEDVKILKERLDKVS